MSENVGNVKNSKNFPAATAAAVNLYAAATAAAVAAPTVAAPAAAVQERKTKKTIKKVIKNRTKNSQDFAEIQFQRRH